MREVYIDFTRPAHRKFPIFSWLIRLVQGTEYSHVRIRWTNSTGVELIYEASGSKVKLIGELAQKDFPVEVLESYTIPIAKVEYKRLISLFKYSSVDYGLKQVFGILLAKIFGLKKNPLSRGRSSQVCSELVALFLTDVKGWKVTFDPDLAGPKEIEEALKKLLDK